MVLTLPKKFEEKDILDYFLKIGNGHKTASKNTKIIIEMQKRNGTASEILQFAECIRSF